MILVTFPGAQPSRREKLIHAQEYLSQPEIFGFLVFYIRQSFLVVHLLPLEKWVLTTNKFFFFLRRLNID